MNPEFIAAILILVGTPTISKFNQKFVDVLKKFKLFANSKPETKRAIAFVAASVITWITTTFGPQVGAIFTGIDITALEVNDVVKAVIGLFVWLTSMYLHDKKPATAA